MCLLLQLSPSLSTQGLGTFPWGVTGDLFWQQLPKGCVCHIQDTSPQPGRSRILDFQPAAWLKHLKGVCGGGSPDFGPVSSQLRSCGGCVVS